MTPADKARGPARRFALDLAVQYGEGMIEMGFPFGEVVDEARRHLDERDHQAVAARLTIIDRRKQ